MPEDRRRYLSRNVALLSFSAFFADAGYQAVTAVFAILLVVQMHQPAYIYGLLLAISFGAGSGFSLIGGILGEKYGKKGISLIGNLLIPLMSISVLFSNIYILGALFIFGWWARYFRTPARRAWMVEISDPAYRSNIFGFLHALDIGGGIIAVSYSVVLILVGVSLKEIILITSVPILVSSVCLAMAGTDEHKDYTAEKIRSETMNAQDEDDPAIQKNNFIFRAIIVSATLFGFSYYAMGFPVITVSAATGSYVFGILTFGVYLSVSAFSGFLLGTLRGKKPLRTLWSLGYLLAAVSSLIIGLSYAFQGGIYLYYIGAAGLGFATGSVETFEPVMIAAVTKAKKMSSGMGWLSSSRAIGLFVSNLVMGVIFVISVIGSYIYAAVTSLAAAIILLIAELLLSDKTRQATKK
ncbi:MAG: MFS transporter [Thermoplasmataceae archaeon]